MKIDELLRTIGSLGWESVLIVLLIGIIYLATKAISNKLASNMSSNMEKLATDLTSSISEQNKNIVDVISKQNDKLIEYITNKDDNKVRSHNMMIEERMKHTEEVCEKLKEITLVHHAAHTMILEFHNSYQNLSGTPFAKYSCTYEWQTKEANPAANIIKGYPFSMISGVVSDIMKTENRQIIYNREDLEDKLILSYEKYNKDHLKYVIYNAMYDNNNNMIGLLVIEYFDELPLNLNLEEIKIETAQITSILNLRYKYVS